MSGANRFDLAVPVSAADHVIGRADAAFTLVEYGDFECPTCKQAAPLVKMLLRKFQEQLRFVYRHFPLEGVHPHALQAAEASECAGVQGRFWEMHDLLFERQLHLKTPDLVVYATELRLDLPRFVGDLEEATCRQRVREHMAGGADSGVRATPTFFINGVLHDVSYGIHTLYDDVVAELGKSH